MTAHKQKIRIAGTTEKGTRHFLTQRLTAFANFFLVIFALITVLRLAGLGFSEARSVISEPVTAVMLILLVISVCYHMKLGMQVIIEDYLHNELFKLISLTANLFYCLGLAVWAIFAILKIAFGG